MWVILWKFTVICTFTFAVDTAGLRELMIAHVDSCEPGLEIWLDLLKRWHSHTSGFFVFSFHVLLIVFCPQSRHFLSSWKPFFKLSNYSGVQEFCAVIWSWTLGIGKGSYEECRNFVLGLVIHSLLAASCSSLTMSPAAFHSFSWMLHIFTLGHVEPLASVERPWRQITPTKKNKGAELVRKQKDRAVVGDMLFTMDPFSYWVSFSQCYCVWIGWEFNFT